MRMNRRRRGDGRVLVDFSSAQQRRDREMLDRGQRQSPGHARKRRGRNDLPQHGRMQSVAGEARRVSRIVRGVMQGFRLRKPGAVDKHQPKQGSAYDCDST